MNAPTPPDQPEDAIQEDLWEALLVLAANQYNAGKRQDPRSDNFSEVITPIHTQLLQLFHEHVQQAVQAARWKRPVDLNDQKYMLQFIDDPIEKFNTFLKKWCPDYAHLIDSDDNDGEEIRQMIAGLQPTQPPAADTTKQGEGE